MGSAPNQQDLTWDLTDRLHKSMRVAGIRSSELGDRIGVSRNTIANYLAGRSTMDRRTLIAWAFATGVPLAWLETGKAPTDPSGPDVDTLLPRLDSNQQPFDLGLTLVRGGLVAA